MSVDVGSPWSSVDVNHKLQKFQALAASVPEYDRLLDDGLCCAIDIYVKHHLWLAETEREIFAGCLKTCTQAEQNERLPLRIIVKRCLLSCFLFQLSMYL